MATANPRLTTAEGQPVDLGALREPQSEQASEAYTRSLKREFDLHPAKGITPARLNAILHQAEAGNLIPQLELADDMEERDSQIYCEMAKRKTAVTTLQWDVEPLEDASSAEQAVADQVREWLCSIPCFEEDVLLELLDAVLKGFRPVEMWWELDQGTLQPRFAPRPQRWLTLSETRDQYMLRDGKSPYGTPLQPWGWILHQHKARNGYLARGSLARVLAWPYLFKHYAVRDLAEFLEIYGLPLRLGKYPAGASDDEKRTLLNAVVGIGHNAGGVIPQSMAIDFQSAADGTDGPFKTMWDGMDAAISKVILGQTLTASEGQHGTQALGNVHNEVRLDILKSDAKRLAATLTSQLVAPMVLLNIPGADPKRLPKFCIEVPEPEDLALYADALPKLAAAGLRIGVGDVHRRLNIEEAEEGEEVLQGVLPSGASAAAAPGGEIPPGPPSSKGGGPGLPADGGDPANIDPASTDPAVTADLAAKTGAAQPPRDAIDVLVDELAGRWKPVLGPMVQPLLAALDQAVASGQSLRDFRAQLPELVARMDSAPAAELLARAAFSAHLAGETDRDLS